MKKLLQQVRSCRICQEFLPNPPRPVLQAGSRAKICIIGQAPGSKVQESGIPWDDKSGDELRNWLGVTPEEFYNDKLFALTPMGFCYPGKGITGDLPPRKECAPEWHQKILDKMPGIELTILIGSYAQKYYLKERNLKTLTENVQAFHKFLPEYFTLVHPSPLNFRWRTKNKWFEEETIPHLQNLVNRILKRSDR